MHLYKHSYTLICLVKFVVKPGITIVCCSFFRHYEYGSDSAGEITGKTGLYKIFSML